MDSIRRDILRESIRNQFRKIASLEKAVNKAKMAKEVQEDILTGKRRILIAAQQEHIEALEENRRLLAEYTALS